MSATFIVISFFVASLCLWILHLVGTPFALLPDWATSIVVLMAMITGIGGAILFGLTTTRRSVKRQEKRRVDVTTVDTLNGLVRKWEYRSGIVDAARGSVYAQVAGELIDVLKALKVAEST